MMTAAEFHKRKAIGRKEHKNPIAQDLYTLLQAYESAQNTPNRKIKLLVLMYFLTLEYIWAKDGTKKGGFDPSSKKGQKNLVVQLQQDIEQEVQSFSFNLQHNRMAEGEHYKGGVKQTDAGQGRALSGAYKVEKVAPRANLVNKYGLNTTIPAFGMSLLTQTIESEFQVAGNGAAQSEQMAHQRIAGMSMTELFKELHKLWHNANVQNMNFTFFNSAQRLPYMATCNNGVWSCNGQTPYTTGMNWGQLVPVMYVMDTSERLFIADGIATGGGQFNHSSVLSGAPCTCAGTLKINGAGKLVYIDNDSGHYKPNTADLKEAVRVLVQEFSIPAFGVQVMDKATGQTTSLLQWLH